MATIAVIGSMNMDVVLFVEEVPEDGQNVYAKATMRRCGGKGANAAIAMSKLGNTTLYYGCAGNDASGDSLCQNLEHNGVNPKWVQRKNAETGIAYVLIQQDGSNRIIVAPGANESISREDIKEHALPLIKAADMVLIQLEINPDAIEEIIQLCRQYNKKLVIDAGPIRGIAAHQLRGVWCVSPNESELEALMGFPVRTMQDVEAAAQALVQKYSVENVLVKLGGKGAYFANAHESFFAPAYNVNVVDTTAAGDSFMAGFCTSFLENKNIRRAVKDANKCGAIAVTRMGSSDSVPSWEDLENFNALPKNNDNKEQQA